MGERPRFFDDLAGVAGGAFSALAGMREEVEATVRARVDEAIRRLDLVKREDLEAVQEMAAMARTGQETAEARLAALEAKVATLTAAAAAATQTSHATATASSHASAMATDGTQAAPPSVPPATTDSGAPFVPPAMD